MKGTNTKTIPLPDHPKKRQTINPSYHMLIGKKLSNNPYDRAIRIDREILEMAIWEMDKALKVIHAQQNKDKVKEEDEQPTEDSTGGAGSSD